MKKIRRADTPHARKVWAKVDAAGRKWLIRQHCLQYCDPDADVIYLFAPHESSPGFPLWSSEPFEDIGVPFVRQEQ